MSDRERESMTDEQLNRIEEKCVSVLGEEQCDPEEPYYLALEVPDLLGEIKRLKAVLLEVEEERDEIGIMYYGVKNQLEDLGVIIDDEL